MALFDRKAEPRTKMVVGIRRGHPRAVGHRGRERFRRRRLREARQGLRPHLRPDAASRPRCRRSSGWTSSPASGCSRSASAPASTSSLYPRDCTVTGIDFSSSMLEKARERVARKGIRNVRLLQMDAADLKFADDSFDIVYAPYLISVVPDPVEVAREMRRVCRPGGRIIILNHFRSPNPILSRDRAADLAVHGSHRLQVGPRPAGVPRAGRAQAACRSRR